MTVAEEDLNQYLRNYTDFNDWLIGQRYQLLTRYFTGRSCLELGPATGEGTAHLLDHFPVVVAVDGSQQVAENLAKRFAGRNLRVECAYFEDLALTERFDTVVLAHVLEHVDDPRRVLESASRLLAPDGIMIVDVPNAMSLHRQLGVEMGLLGAVTDLHEGDLSIGHKRVYTPEAFRRELTDAGLAIDRFGGLFLKLLSNAQTEAVFDAAQLAALVAVGERYPEISAEIYAVVRRPRPA
jgi:2-polyprenyl-3-methyl-5-hydroxy-6-metoxy-1,4-benzoquinol methylase